MFHRLDDRPEGVLGYRLSGTLTSEEVERIQEDLQASLEAQGKARMLIEFGNLEAPQPGAVWQDLKFTPEYVKDVERFAIVGEEKWQESAASLADAITRGEARYFENGNEAREWIGRDW